MAWENLQRTKIESFRELIPSIIRNVAGSVSGIECQAALVGLHSQHGGGKAISAPCAVCVAGLLKARFNCSMKLSVICTLHFFPKEPSDGVKKQTASQRRRATKLCSVKWTVPTIEDPGVGPGPHMTGHCAMKFKSQKNFALWFYSACMRFCSLDCR
jgi:hypothetical protein